MPLLWNTVFPPATMPAAFAEGYPFGRAGHAGQLMAEGEDAVGLSAGLTRSALAYFSCRVPAQILGGDRDIMANTPRHGFRASLPFPGARFRSLPRTGLMLRDQHPDAVLEAAQAVLHQKA